MKGGRNEEGMKGDLCLHMFIALLNKAVFSLKTAMFRVPSIMANSQFPLLAEDPPWMRGRCTLFNQS